MSELIRFDVESHDGKPAICIEAGKGYWTPWYIAQRRINELRSSRDEYRSNHERLVEALRDCEEVLSYVAKKSGLTHSDAEGVAIEARTLLAALEAEKGGEL